jgi:hypothetical protein
MENLIIHEKQGIFHIYRSPKWIYHIYYKHKKWWIHYWRLKRTGEYKDEGLFKFYAKKSAYSRLIEELQGDIRRDLEIKH